ncbi:TauD/TfdA family dioxygenase [Xanthobacter sp. V4C-4]|uniref:TauD/TfdA dioxygenase family protein n=1 Tax=Xanthobacter cornucopiae TaxID=3119924 RepID=UPI00372A997E
MSDHSVLNLRPLAGRLGAEVADLRVSGDLHPATVKAIHAALLEYKVLFFRGQDHLDDPTQEAFARLFGDLNEHPTIPSKDGTEAILEVASERGEVASHWHADFTFLDTYPQITLLRPVVLPPKGGDTLWGNTEAAYDELPESLKTLADQLWTLHTNDYDYVSDRPFREKREVRHKELFTRKVFETEQPLVAVHPHTGKKVLIVGNFIQRILGYRSSDSHDLLEIFTRHATSPENTLRWSWKLGDLAVWDNRATVHRAIDDFGSAPRTLRRSTVVAEPAVGVDGRRATTRVVGEKPKAVVA